MANNIEEYLIHEHFHNHTVGVFSDTPQVMKDRHDPIRHSHVHRVGFGEHHDHREEPNYRD